MNCVLYIHWLEIYYHNLTNIYVIVVIRTQHKIIARLILHAMVSLSRIDSSSELSDKKVKEVSMINNVL